MPASIHLHPHRLGLDENREGLLPKGNGVYLDLTEDLINETRFVLLLLFS